MQPLKIDKPIRLIELFAGIGSQAKALKLLNANFEHYRICEFDKYAIKSYNAIHGTNFETSDITKITAGDLGIVDTDKYCYIMTYSFPCQDLSLAGKQKGMAKGENTRSGLLWEVERLLNECTELPQILLMENVTQVHGTKNVEHFNEWLAYLESKGYKNYWKDLNAKNFCIPQNRNRTFMVSVLGDYTYEFPQEFPLKKRLKDLLEDSVDEKFYISNEKVEKIVENLSQINDTATALVGKQATEFKKLTDVSNTLMARDYKGFGNQEMNCVIEPIRVGGLYDTETSKHQAGAIWDKEAIAPTVDTMQGGNRQPLVTVEPNERFFKQALETLKENDCSVGDTIDAYNKKVNSSGISPTITTRPEGFKTAILPVVEPLAYDEQNGYIRKDGTVGTLTTDGSSPKHNNRVVENMRIRKLTPRECFRLMGFQDEDFEKAAQHNSNSQLYKQAGNSVCVSVLYYIFKEMM